MVPDIQDTSGPDVERPLRMFPDVPRAEYANRGGAGGGGDGEEKEVTDEANTESAEKSKKQKTTSPHLRGCPPAPDASDAGEACLSSRSNRLWASDQDGRERIPLRTFGLAYYKLRSELWRPAEVADWLKTMQGGARGWLRGQKVIHPDFEFFQTRG